MASVVPKKCNLHPSAGVNRQIAITTTSGRPAHKVVWVCNQCGAIISDKKQ